MQLDTEKPGRFEGVPTSQHVSDLLAAINRIESVPHIQVPSHRAHDEQKPEASYSPIRHADRIAQILDAFAALCVSREKHEVIAVAVRHDKKNSEITFMMASNADVLPATAQHFRDMWDMMRRLATRYKEYLGSQPEDISPAGPIQDPQFQSLDREFSQMCLSFVWLRLQSRVNGKFSRFQRLVQDLAGLDQRHPFSQVAQAISLVESGFTRQGGRQNGATCGKPRNDKEWRWLHDRLREVKIAIDAFLNNEKALSKVKQAQLRHFPELYRYLRKINSVFNSIKTLVRATLSPKTRDLLFCQPNLKTLREQSTKLANVPTTTADWKRVLRDALAYHNQRNDAGKEGTRVMKLETIREDTAKMCIKTISKDNAVHCEVKLLVAIAKEEVTGLNLPKAFTYIGVSKLSCNGCDCFIRAFNSVHETYWATKGSHGKSYYPWMFPHGTPEEDDVRAKTYSNITLAWAQSYSGYCQPHVPLDPDSTALSSQGGNFWDYEKGPEDIELDKEFERLHLARQGHNP